MSLQRRLMLAFGSRIGVAIAVLATVILAAGSAFAAGRSALLVANSSYTNTDKLPNPVNDAALIANKLRELGFTVRIEKDLDARHLSEVIQQFASSLNKESDALFYYAGHGLQFGGENFLVGVDAKLDSEATLQFETFRLNTVLNLLEARAGTTLLFWDACRNNPLADALARTSEATARAILGGVRSGAAPIAPSRGDTLVVFSAEPGKLALDGEGQNSPFAASLARHIASPNVEVESMLKAVARDVLAATKDYQRPQRLSQLTRDFYFQPGTQQVAEDQELSKLRMRLAMLEQQQPRSRERFRILSANDPALAGATKIVTRGGKPAEIPAAAPQQAAAPAPASTASVSADAPPAGEVVIAVDSPAATIIRKLAVSPDGRLLALGDDDGMVRIILIETFEVIRSIRAHTARVSDLNFAPDSRTLLSAGRDGALRYWNVDTGDKTRELSIPGAIPYSARMNSTNPDKWVLMGDKAGKLIAWDIQRNKIITNTKFHDGAVLAVDYQPGGGGTFISAAGDGELKIRAAEGPRQTLQAHKGAIFVARYSTTGKLLYTAGADRKLKIWDAASAKTGARPKYELDGHLRYVLTADMSNDEQLLVSGGADKGINLWNVQSGKLIGQLKGHTSDVEAVAFTPNGKFVVSASEDKTVRVWSVDGGAELVRLFFQKAGPKYAGVTLENQAFGDHDSGLISIWQDGRVIPAEQADKIVPYLGRQIAIVTGD